MTTVRAIVQKVIQEGDHGPFAVAEAEGLEGSTTFSLEPTVWQEEEWPEEGMIVVLGKLRKKRAGWRAKTGRFLQPSDEQAQHGEQSSQTGSTLLQIPFLDEVLQQAGRLPELKHKDVPSTYIPNWHGTFEIELGRKHFSLLFMDRGAFQLENHVCELTFGVTRCSSMFFRAQNIFPVTLKEKFSGMFDLHEPIVGGMSITSPDRTFDSSGLEMWDRFHFFHLLAQFQQEVLPQLMHKVKSMKTGAPAFTETFEHVRKVCASLKIKG